MKKNIIYIEKIIGVFQIIWGIFALFVSVYGLKVLYEVGLKYFQMTQEKISVLGVIRIYHCEFILGILTIVAGLLLFLSKKSGWMLAIIISFVTGTQSIISLLYLYFIPAKSGFNKTQTTLLDLITFVVFFVIFAILLSGRFKIKYSPVKKTWWTISIITGLLLFDKIVFEIIK